MKFRELFNRLKNRQLLKFQNRNVTKEMCVCVLRPSCIRHYDRNAPKAWVRCPACTSELLRHPQRL
jgi:hypothetical protein